MLHLDGQQSIHVSHRYSHRSEIAFDSGAGVLREGINTPRCNVLAIQRSLRFSSQGLQAIVRHKFKRFGRGVPHEQVEN
jgi:hypothetical protein